MTPVDSALENPLVESIFSYAGQILANRPVNFLGIGNDGAALQAFAERSFGTRLTGSRVMISLKGYMHGNTKKPDPASVDLLFIDARDHDPAKLSESVRAALQSSAPRARIVLIAKLDVLESSAALALRQLVTDRYSVTHIHVSGDDADGAVIWIGNATPSIKQAVVLSRGGLPTSPKHMIDIPINAVRNTENWSDIVPGDAVEETVTADQLSAYFDIRPGVTTGNDKLLILPTSEIERLGIEADAFRPVLPDPSQLDDEIIEGRPGGFPDTNERLMILQVDSDVDLKARYPNLASHLETAGALEAEETPVWYALETPPVPPIVCAARDGQPCCFFLNRSKAIATDKFVALYPKPAVAAAIAGNASLVAQIWGEITKAVDDANQDVTLENLPRFEVPSLKRILPPAN
jgi:hypothetical protein